MQTTATRERVESVVTDALRRFGIDESQIGPGVPLESLDIDSLDVVELGQMVRKEVGVRVTPEEIKDLQTIGDVIDHVTARAG